MKKVLCFDLGWTLEDESEAQLDRAAQVTAICRGHGIEVDPDELLELQVEAGSRGIPQVFPHALAEFDLPPAALEDLRRRLRWNTGKLALYEGAAALLDSLAHDNDLALLANQSRPVADRLSAYGIASRFDHVVCSCEVGLEKPVPAIFHLLAAHWAGQQREFWMIGDRIDNDIAPAKALGWKTVRVLQGDHRRQKPKGPAEKADYEIASLAGLAGMMARGIL